MAAIVIDGKALAEQIKESVRQQVETLTRKPGLAMILMGDNPASRTYINGKTRDCIQCGIYSEEYILPEKTTQTELLNLIGTLNDRANIDGILIELPLPKHITEREILCAIRPDKDVDCFHPFNVGKLMSDDSGFRPCTPAGIMRILEHYKINLDGQHCVIVGQSNIVGRPQAMLLLHRDATVTICHSRTRDLKAQCLQADILITAVGKVGLITEDMVKDGVVVIDVAMNRNQENKLCGDVDYAAVSKKASYITPVPGGVGPMTRAMLMESTLLAAKNH